MVTAYYETLALLIVLRMESKLPSNRNKTTLTCLSSGTCIYKEIGTHIVVNHCKNGLLKGGTVSDFFVIHCCKTSKNERRPFEEILFRKKVSQCQKKVKGGTLHPFCRQASKKLKRGPLRKKHFEKIVSHGRKKTEMGLN